MGPCRRTIASKAIALPVSHPDPADEPLEQFRIAQARHDPESKQRINVVDDRFGSWIVHEVGLYRSLKACNLSSGRQTSRCKPLSSILLVPIITQLVRANAFPNTAFLPIAPKSRFYPGDIDFVIMPG